MNLKVALVTGNLFSVLGVTPLLGRNLQARGRQHRRGASGRDQLRAVAASLWEESVGAGSRAHDSRAAGHDCRGDASRLWISRPDGGVGDGASVPPRRGDRPARLLRVPGRTSRAWRNGRTVRVRAHELSPEQRRAASLVAARHDRVGQNPRRRPARRRASRHSPAAGGERARDARGDRQRRRPVPRAGAHQTAGTGRAGVAGRDAAALVAPGVERRVDRGDRGCGPWRRHRLWRGEAGRVIRVHAAAARGRDRSERRDARLRRRARRRGHGGVRDRLRVRPAACRALARAQRGDSRRHGHADGAAHPARPGGRPGHTGGHGDPGRGARGAEPVESRNVGSGSRWRPHPDGPGRASAAGRLRESEAIQRRPGPDHRGGRGTPRSAGRGAAPQRAVWRHVWLGCAVSVGRTGAGGGGTPAAAQSRNRVTRLLPDARHRDRPRPRVHRRGQRRGTSGRDPE